MRCAQFFAMASRDDGESPVSLVGVAHGNPARHQRVGFARQIVRILVQRDSRRPFSRFLGQVHGLDHLGRAAEKLRGYARHVRMGS